MEGTAFWLVVSAILTGGSAYGAPLALAALALAYAVVYAIAAFFVWNHHRWAFVLAIVIALVALVGNVVFGSTESLATVTGFEILSLGAWLAIPQFLVIFYSLRAYRELAAA